MKPKQLPATVFYTFGDGSIRWRRASNRLVKDIGQSQLFYRTFNFNFHWLESADEETYKLCREFIASGKSTGAGFWAWKSAILKWHLENFSELNFLYADSGFVYADNPVSRGGLCNLINTIEQQGSLALQLPNHYEIEWTKRATLESLDENNIFSETLQIQGGFIGLASRNLMHFSSEYRSMILFEGGRLIDDSISGTEDSRFKSHRNDQSVFSLLWKKYEFHTIPDNTDPIQNPEILIAARYSSGFNYFSKSFFIRVLRYAERVISRIHQPKKIREMKKWK